MRGWQPRAKGRRGPEPVASRGLVTRLTGAPRPAGAAIPRVMMRGGGPGAMRARRGGNKKPPSLMDPSRERDRHRILALFRPYRSRLVVVLSMIVFSAGLSMLSPFLLRPVLDRQKV